MKCILGSRFGLLGSWTELEAAGGAVGNDAELQLGLLAAAAPDSDLDGGVAALTPLS